MFKWALSFSARLIEWWEGSIRHHSLLVVTISLLATAGVLVYTIKNLQIDTDLSNMISDRLPYRRLEKEFQKAFPQLENTILVVVDAESPEAARHQRDRLVARLKKERSIFKRVYLPGSGEFFDKNGLLYLSVKELQELADNLANVQPLFGLLSRNFSLRGIFSVIEKVIDQQGETEQIESLIPLFDGLRMAFESAASGRPYQVSWQELMFGKGAAREKGRQFIIFEPNLNTNTLSSGEAAIEAVHRIRDELGHHHASGVTVRLTGDVVLAYENLEAVRSGIGISTLLSFILVAIALVLGLGSLRLVFSSLLTLLVGLVWTLGFAIAVIGHLNLISVTFGVLFIGLGIDYGIQFCFRYRELTASGVGYREASVRTAKGMAISLRLCTVGAAIGFYSFLPTAYTGVSELGLIAGTGMFINLLATLTVLPALLILMPPKKDRTREFTFGRILSLVPYEHARVIRIGAVVSAIAAFFFVVKISFDYNPLNLYDPNSEGVSTIRELFKDAKTSPWTISVLARNAKGAQEIGDRLRALKQVKEVITLADFVPDDQSKKLGIISDMALLMPPGLENLKPESLSYAQKVASLKNFKRALEESLSRSPKEGGQRVASIQSLCSALDGFETALKDPENGKSAFKRLENSLLSNLPVLFKDLETSFQANRFGESDLPQALRAQYATPEGVYRMEVFPSENILKIDALERFVDAVTTVAPNAIDTPVTIREAGKAVVQSFLQATIYAILAITAYLLIELKSVRDTALVLLPLTFSLLLTGAASVVLNIPFNFANVIVIPLLLGSGVEGIYLIYRFRTEPPSNGNMLQTSTARALFFCTLTTILSFSTLSFSPHQGMASMGKLLTICMGLLMISTLFLLPGLLKSGNPRAEP
jgi:hopanoid biosynthesis associated RND transporter like protein HpnN